MPISEVYNMDCMEYMKGIPDKFFDLAIVDPQYGIDIMHKGGMPKHLGFKQYKRKDWDKKPPIWQFVEKLAEHGNGIALLFNRCDSNKFQDIIFTKATGMMFLRNRIKFFRPDGTRGDSPGCGSVLIAFGRENAEILRNCSLQGKYVELNNDK